MAEQIIAMIVQCIRAVNDWFMSLINASGMVTMVVGFISITLAARFILQPIIGGGFFHAASDRVKKEVDARTPKPKKGKSG